MFPASTVSHTQQSFLSNHTVELLGPQLNLLIPPPWTVGCWPSMVSSWEILSRMLNIWACICFSLVLIVTQDWWDVGYVMIILPLFFQLSIGKRQRHCHLQWCSCAAKRWVRLAKKTRSLKVAAIREVLGRDILLVRMHLNANFNCLEQKGRVTVHVAEPHQRCILI